MIIVFAKNGILTNAMCIDVYNYFHVILFNCQNVIIMLVLVLPGSVDI